MVSRLVWAAVVFFLFFFQGSVWPGGGDRSRATGSATCDLLTKLLSDFGRTFAFFTQASEESARVLASGEGVMN